MRRNCGKRYLSRKRIMGEKTRLDYEGKPGFRNKSTKKCQYIYGDPYGDEADTAWDNLWAEKKKAMPPKYILPLVLSDLGRSLSTTSLLLIDRRENKPVKNAIKNNNTTII